MAAVTLTRASSTEDICCVRTLLEEYVASLDVSLDFQGFAEELATLPGAYAPPSGRLLLARVEGQPAGCVALRALGETVCEMKRLFVRPPYLGHGIGRRLAMAIIDEARGAGYGVIRLDTLPSMRAAAALYESMGFKDIASYTHNPVAGTRFMELSLTPR